MAGVKKSKKDGSIWFSDITDSAGAVRSDLMKLKSEQAVELRINGETGIWLRFKGKGVKVPPALKRGNADAKRIWDALTQGDSASLELVRFLSDDESRQYSSERAGHVNLIPIESKIEANVLCLGVDVAWWGGGGSPSDKGSRTETITYATRIEGNWSELSLKRVDLNPSYKQDPDPHKPNSDPNADLLVSSIMEVVESHEQFGNVVLALDMPILANDEGMKSPKKAYAQGEAGGAYRQCDRVWMDSKKLSPAGWRNVNIMTGAPIAPRIKALVSKLEANAFSVLGKTPDMGERVLFECFPNEILWSTGMLGLAEGLTFDTLQLYKSIGRNNLPLPQQFFHALWKLPVELALSAAGLSDETITRWHSQFLSWLVSDQTFNASTKIGRTGKKFDDAIDSVLSLSAVVGFVEGHAHIHQGLDPKDGHIVGPGLLSIGTES